jgi:hypothetical protein
MATAPSTSSLFCGVVVPIPTLLLPPLFTIKEVLLAPPLIQSIILKSLLVAPPPE